MLLLCYVVGPCYGAGRGHAAIRPPLNRRTQYTTFSYNPSRAAQSGNINNFVSAQPEQEKTEDNVNGQSDVTIDVATPAPATENNQPTIIQTSDASEELFTDAEISEIVSSLEEIVSALNSEISTLDAELSRCKREKKTNTIITTVGAAGVLGTGIGAIVQGKKLHDKKKSGATEQEETEAKSE